MKSLIAFIVNHLFSISFLILEAISFYFIYINNTFTSERIAFYFNELAGYWYEKKSAMYNYLYLRKENELLAKFNTHLLNNTHWSYNIMYSKEFTVKDTIKKREYSYIMAIVINSTFNRQKNFITLNVGKNMGLQRDMAVICNNGIVGSIKDVSEHYATVITLLHKDFIVNCMLKDGSCGPLSWDGKSRQYLQMKDVPLHAKIKKGDTVYTSHFSHIFPVGIPVGVIEDFERKQKESFYTLNIKIFTDFNSIQTVYVVKHIYKNEFDSLQKDLLK